MDVTGGTNPSTSKYVGSAAVDLLIRSTLDSLRNDPALHQHNVTIVIQRPDHDPRRIHDILFRVGRRVLRFSLHHACSDTCQSRTQPRLSCVWIYRTEMTDEQFNETVLHGYADPTTLPERVCADRATSATATQTAWLAGGVQTTNTTGV